MGFWNVLSSNFRSIVLNSSDATLLIHENWRTWHYLLGKSNYEKKIWRQSIRKFIEQVATIYKEITILAKQIYKIL